MPGPGLYPRGGVSSGLRAGKYMRGALLPNGLGSGFGGPILQVFIGFYSFLKAAPQEPCDPANLTLQNRND